jgi:hypothetical protein
MLNIVVVKPIPIASARTALRARPGLRLKILKLVRASER